MIEGFKRDAENLVLFFKRYVYFTNDILLLEIINLSLGDTSDEGTPGNIPNPEVKLVSADGTWGAAPWESRSLPRDFFYLIFQDTRHPTPFGRERDHYHETFFI